MSTGRRAYDLLRGYVNKEWERIKGIEVSDAERELNEALWNPASASRPTGGPPSPVPQPQDPKAYARRLLGVSEDTPFEDLRKCYSRLMKRSDPANFPSGSEEAKQAATIQRRVNWAYNTLTAHMDDTERRFRSLELE